MTDPVVVAVHRSDRHAFSKQAVEFVRLIERFGIEGDAHAGETVQHRSRVAADPTQPNLRQVHLIASELHEELAAKGFDIAWGAMGENITSRGVDLLGLATGTRLRLGDTAVVEITGLRNPCGQLDGLEPGLRQAVLDRDAGGNLIRRAGVMGVVECGGIVRPGDTIEVVPPTGEPRPLQPV